MPRGILAIILSLDPPLPAILTFHPVRVMVMTYIIRMQKSQDQRSVSSKIERKQRTDGLGLIAVPCLLARW